jgi:hypothetical protein
MARSGFQAGFSLGRARGFTGRSISMGTSIIISTTAKATTDPCRHAVNTRRNIVKSFMVTPCTIRGVARVPRDTGKSLHVRCFWPCATKEKISYSGSRPIRRARNASASSGRRLHQLASTRPNPLNRHQLRVRRPDERFRPQGKGRRLDQVAAGTREVIAEIRAPDVRAGGQCCTLQPGADPRPAW